MAVTTWTDGAGDGNWNTVGNWDTGAVPVDNDDVIISRGTRAILLGLNQSGINLNSLTITPGFKGASIGDETTSLQINTNGAGGTNTLSCEMSPNTRMVKVNGTFPTMIVDGTGQGSFFITGGTTTLLAACGSGTVVVAIDSTVTTLKAGGTAKVIARAIGTGAAFTTVYVSGDGQVWSERDAATVYCAGRYYTVSGSTATVTTKIWISTGGFYNHQSRGATIAAMEVESAGRFSPRGCETALTVTALVRWRGAQVDRKGGASNVTFTAETVYGGDVSAAGGMTPAMVGFNN